MRRVAPSTSRMEKPSILRSLCNLVPGISEFGKSKLHRFTTRLLKIFWFASPSQCCDFEGMLLHILKVATRSAEMCNEFFSRDESFPRALSGNKNLDLKSQK